MAVLQLQLTVFSVSSWLKDLVYIILPKLNMFAIIILISSEDK